ncbi:MAG TPA: type I-C CRISPR-associated protein Cas8c/Csd1, partial [Tepidisphaeraceae bacterium]|nr:type I-C CRISPR-associated protein Cas8c/Csd1 [Tepidisphaeraceae bacterium]
MSQVSSGPLPALIRYYQRLAADPSQPVPEFGFSREKIHFQIVLEPDGTLPKDGLSDIRQPGSKGKRVARLLLVPDGGGRSGTGLKPFFCWDNTGYALGRDNKNNPERAAQMFAAFRELHLSMRSEVGDDEGYAALCRFLEQWDPARAESLSNWQEAAGLNVVFKLRGREGFIHQSPAVRQAWLRRLAIQSQAEGAIHAVSLISGQEEPIARLHPLISGVAGANTTGAAIVSFNLDAFESYGKKQSFNAPVGVHDAFRYTTALNRLLADDERRVRIGDATVVFWTDRPQAGDSEKLLALIFGEDAPRGQAAAEHGVTLKRLEKFLHAAREGRLIDEVRDPEAPFYVLGLSPNASRLNVRYWLAGTVQQFAQRLARHAADLEMTCAPPNEPPLVIRR